MQTCSLPVDLLKAFFLRREFGAQRRKLVADGVQAATIILQLTLGALELCGPVGERGARLRRGDLRRLDGPLKVFDVGPTGLHAARSRQIHSAVNPACSPLSCSWAPVNSSNLLSASR